MQDSPEIAMVCTRTSSNGLGILLPCTGESESVIMIGVADRRDEWVGPSSRPERLRASLRLVWQNLQLERNGALFGVHGLVRPKVLDRGRHCQRRDFASTVLRRFPKSHDSSHRGRDDDTGEYQCVPHDNVQQTCFSDDLRADKRVM